jgi:hypothetical protein
MPIFFSIEILCTIVISTIDSLALFVLGMGAHNTHPNSIGIQSCSSFVGIHAKFKQCIYQWSHKLQHREPNLESYFAHDWKQN